MHIAYGEVLTLQVWNHDESNHLPYRLIAFSPPRLIAFSPHRLQEHIYTFVLPFVAASGANEHIGALGINTFRACEGY